ncbi:MAG: response regulator [Desulfuromonadales bacterium]|nr:response regulator [Desulfuromonadales bacterium]
MTALRTLASKIKLLIVEDDCEMRAVLCDAIQLKYPFFTIFCAENGGEGLESFQQQNPDVVISDINMPIMNGIQMTKEIRTLNPSALIIILTAHSDTDYLLDAIRTGINRYILKPIVFSELFETIDACCAQVYLRRQVLDQDAHIRKLSRAVEQSPIAVLITDSNGVIEYSNSKCTDLTGYTQEEIVGENVFDQTAPAHLRDPKGTIWSSVSAGQTWHGEIENQKKNGATFWELVDISWLLNEAGGTSHFVIIREDITELRQIREEMLKTAKLESLGILAGGIAHDFNNILTSILGNIFMARIHLAESEKATLHLHAAENSIERAKNLAQELLTFAQGGAPVKKQLALGDLLKNATLGSLNGSTVSCHFIFKEDIWPVEADEEQLSQVIHNLVINAVQAMPMGGALTIQADNVSSSTDGKRFVKISVMDTGTGISQQDLPKIFDPYFTTKEQGKGLGLASCHSIIRKHGGKIRATSTLGTGSIFQISLPASQNISEPAPSCSAEIFRGSEKILVMDDEKIIRDVVQAILENFGYEVECVENGTDAAKLYQKRREQNAPFSAVILDLSIPGGIGGKETIEMLLKIDPNVKAIVSSGYSSDPVMANYRDYGFSAVLRKPYLPQELCRVIRKLTLK